MRLHQIKHTKKRLPFRPFSTLATPVRRLAVEAHAARTVRVPTWVELFGHRGGIAGNRELVPEDITSWDAGLTVRPHGRLSLRAAVFAAATDGTIVYVANSQQTSRPINAGATRNRGLLASPQRS